MTVINFEDIKPIIELALQEDIGSGDVTTDSIIPDEMITSASLMAKAPGIIAGLPVAEYVFKSLSPEIDWHPLINDGGKVNNGDIIAKIKGSYRALLTGERLALNFVQRMSGIASMTSKFVEEIKEFKTRILDTRKTVPGLRILDKYAVRIGGGINHRIGLYDMVLIKDNHSRVAGGISNAIDQIRKKTGHRFKIEVEATTLDEVVEALGKNADMIMLDNMNTSTMAEAVRIINGRAEVEASGNMSFNRIKEVAATGVNYISIGALTHSVVALDISMNIEIK